MQAAIEVLREWMKANSVDLVLVLSTDPYQNEYVPQEESLRFFISGFSGSVGDVLIAQEEALLFVDGRYALQAQKEAPHFTVQVMPLGKSIQQGWMEWLSTYQKKRQGQLVIEGDRTSILLFSHLEKTCQKNAWQLVTHTPSIVSEIKNNFSTAKPSLAAPRQTVFSVSADLTGASISERLQQCKAFLEENSWDGQLLVLLDEIAWLTNLRGHDFPYQSTFAARAIAFRKEVWVITEKEISALPVQEKVRYCSYQQLPSLIKEHFSSAKPCIAIDRAHTPIALLQILKEAGAEVVEGAGPLASFKSIKNAIELKHMYEGFQRADKVVEQTQRWVCESVLSGKKVTEADVKRYVSEAFMASGAIELSFKPICAAGENGAIIHYGSPDDTKGLSLGTQFLLDTGGIYEGGYSTDLTRTFWIGDERHPPTSEHRYIFTCVLKGAIAGMSARIPHGTKGSQLDALVRAPIWRAGYNFAHGTGHGVGINVHEFPPRISPVSEGILQNNQVFSIEPGIYLPGFGGVRIENLCILVDDPEQNGYHRVLPLTFAAFDKQLIAEELLTESEQHFLDYCEECRHLGRGIFPPLPPLK